MKQLEQELLEQEQNPSMLFKKAFRPVVMVSLVTIMLGLAGCLGAVTLVVTPDLIVINPGQSVTFAANTVAGTAVTGVGWAVTSGVGTIDAASGIYTAPTIGIATVTTATVEGSKGTSTGTATIIIKPPLAAAIVDPDGDAFGTTTYDILDFQTSRTDTILTVTITFDTVPTIPAAGASAAGANLTGFIDFDTDESFATGANSANSTFCPSFPISAIGSEFFMSFFQRNVSGNYDIFDTNTLVDVGDAAVTLNGVQVVLTIPLTELNNDDGSLKFNSVLGDAIGSTDCAPDEGAGVATSEGVGAWTAPEISVVGNPHLDYLTSIGFDSWQTPSGTI